MRDASVSFALNDEHLRRLQRARILEALAESLAEVGYARLRVADIAERGGFSRKTFYEFFDNKADAFFAAYDELLERVERLGRAASRRARSRDAKVHEALRAITELFAAQPQWAALVVDAPTVAALEGDRERHLRGVIEWLSEAAGRLGLRASVPPAEQAALVLGLLQAHFHRGQFDSSGLIESLMLIVAGTGPPKPGKLAPATVKVEFTPDALVAALIDHDAARLMLFAADGPHDLTTLARVGLRGGILGVLQCHGAAAGGKVSGQAHEVLRYLEANPGLSGRELLGLLEIKHESQISRLLGDLERRGLAAAEKHNGRTKRWRLTRAGASLLSA